MSQLFSPEDYSSYPGAVHTSFANNAINDLARSTVGLVTVMPSLGLHLLTDPNQFQKDMSSMEQGFFGMSPIPSLLQGNVGEAAHRFYQNPFSSTLDFAAPFMAGTKGLGYLGRQAGNDRAWALSGYAKLADGGANDFLAHTNANRPSFLGEAGLSDGLLAANPQSPMLTMLGQDPAKTSIFGSKPASPLGFLFGDRTTPIQVPAEEFKGGVIKTSPQGDTYIKRTHRMVGQADSPDTFGTGIRSYLADRFNFVDPPKEDLVNKFMADAAATPVVAQMRSRNEYVAQFGDRLSAFMTRNMAGSSPLLGRADWLGRRWIKPALQNMSAEQTRVESEFALMKDQTAKQLWPDLAPEQAAQRLGDLTDFLGVAKDEHMPTAIDLMLKQHEPPTISADMPIDLKDIRDKLTRAKIDVLPGNDHPVKYFDTAFNRDAHLANADVHDPWIIRHDEYLNGLSDMLRNPNLPNMVWDTQPGQILRTPIGHTPPVVRQAREAAVKANEDTTNKIYDFNRDAQNMGSGTIIGNLGDPNAEWYASTHIPTLLERGRSGKGGLATTLTPEAAQMEHMAKHVDRPVFTQEGFADSEAKKREQYVTHAERSIGVPVDGHGYSSSAHEAYLPLDPADHASLTNPLTHEPLGEGQKENINRVIDSRLYLHKLYGVISPLIGAMGKGDAARKIALEQATKAIRKVDALDGSGLRLHPEHDVVAIQGVLDRHPELAGHFSGHGDFSSAANLSNSQLAAPFARAISNGHRELPNHWQDHHNENHGYGGTKAIQSLAGEGGVLHPDEMSTIMHILGHDDAGLLGHHVDALLNDDLQARRMTQLHKEMGTDKNVRDTSVIMHHPFSTAAHHAASDRAEAFLSHIQAIDGRVDVPLRDRIQNVLEANKMKTSGFLSELRDKQRKILDEYDHRETAYTGTKDHPGMIRIDMEKLRKGDAMPYNLEALPHHVQVLRDMHANMDDNMRVYAHPAWQEWKDYMRRFNEERKAVAEGNLHDLLSRERINQNDTRFATWNYGLHNRIDSADLHTGDGPLPDSRSLNYNELQHDLDQLTAKHGMPRIETVPEDLHHVPIQKLGGEFDDFSLKHARTADDMMPRVFAADTTGSRAHENWLRGQYSRDPQRYVMDARNNLEDAMYKQLRAHADGTFIKTTPAQAIAWMTGKDENGKSLSVDGKIFKKKSLLAPADDRTKQGKKSVFAIVGADNPIWNHLTANADMMQHISLLLKTAGADHEAGIFDQAIRSLGLPNDMLARGDDIAKDGASVQLAKLIEDSKQNSQVYIMPRAFYNAIKSEREFSDGVYHNTFQNFTTFWKSMVLQMNFPKWFIHNISGNAIYLASASNPKAMLAALQHTSRTLAKGNPERLAYLDDLSRRLSVVATATGQAGVLRHGATEGLERTRTGTVLDNGRVAYWKFVNKLADVNAKIGDEPWRLARAHQVLDDVVQRTIDGHLNGELPNGMSRLDLARKLLEDPSVRRHVTEVTLRDMIDFTNLTQFERNWMTLAFPFYSWIKGSLGVGARMITEHPVRSMFLAHLGHAGAAITQQELGPQGQQVPNYLMDSMILGHNSDGTIRRFSTTGWNPMQSATQMASMGLDWLPWAHGLGGPTYQQWGTDNITNSMNPVVRALIGGAAGTDPMFGTSAPRGQNRGTYAASLLGLQDLPLIKDVERFFTPATPKSIAQTNQWQNAMNLIGLGTSDIRRGQMYQRGANEYHDSHILKPGQ